MRASGRALPPPPPSVRALVALFVAVSALTASGVLVAVDRATAGRDGALSFLNPGSSPSPARHFSLAGTIIILALLLHLYPHQGRRQTFTALVGAVGACTLIELTLKLTLPQPAGPMPYTAGSLELTNSFPSGHALRAAVVCAAAVSVLPRKWRILPYLYAIPATLTMLPAEHHHLTDVIGGWLLGSAAAIYALCASATAREPARAGEGRKAAGEAAHTASQRTLPPR